MKKLLILLFSIFISLNSYGEEINSLFGITLYDNAEKYVSSNYIDSNKFKNTETIEGYFDLIMTDKIKTKSPYSSWYRITIDNDNRVHSIYGRDNSPSLEICQEVANELVSKSEKKYQIDFSSGEDPHTAFKIYHNYFSNSSYDFVIQCIDWREKSVTYLQIFIISRNLQDAVNEFYDSGL